MNDKFGEVLIQYRVALYTYDSCVEVASVVVSSDL